MSIELGSALIDNLLYGSAMPVKKGIRAATTTSGTLSSSFENGDTVDGITLITGDRILIKDQVSAVENGLYEVQASGAPLRTVDFESGASASGAIVIVFEGTENSDTMWVCTDDEINSTIGTDALSFSNVGGKLSTASSSASVLDNSIVRYDGTDGKNLQDSGVAISDTNNVSGIGYIELDDVSAPVNPSDGQGRIYKKTGNDGLFWKPDSAGTEVDLTAGSSIGTGASINAEIPTISYATFSTTSSTYVTVTSSNFTPSSGDWLVTFAFVVEGGKTNYSVAIFQNGTVVADTELAIETNNQNTNTKFWVLQHPLTLNGSQELDLRIKRDSNNSTLNVNLSYVGAISIVDNL